MQSRDVTTRRDVDAVMPDVVVVNEGDQLVGPAFGDELSGAAACANAIEQSWIVLALAMDVEQFELDDLTADIEPHLCHLCECAHTFLERR